MRERPAHPLPGVPTLHRQAMHSTSRFEEAVVAASRAQHPLRAEFDRPRNPFRFQIRSLDLGSISVSHARMDYDARYTVTAETTGDNYHLQISQAGEGEVRHGRVDLAVGGRRRGLLLSPGRPTRWRGSVGFRETTVNVGRRALEDRFEAVAGRSCSGIIEFDPAVDVWRGGGAAVCRIVRDMLVRVDGGAGLSNEQIAAWEEWLMDAMLLGLAHSHVDLLRPRGPTGPRGTVRRAEEYIEARFTEPLSIRRVALAVGVSIRTLQRAFSRHRDHSPKQFLAAVRLDRARGMLLAPRPECSVTAVALATGHSHLGQFSVDYRRRFGETPSETLRRTRSAAFAMAIPPVHG